MESKIETILSTLERDSITKVNTLCDLELSLFIAVDPTLLLAEPCTCITTRRHRKIRSSPFSWVPVGEGPIPGNVVRGSTDGETKG